MTMNTRMIERSAGPAWAVPRTGVKRDDCFFYHTSELSDGSVCPGHWDLRGRFGDYIGHVDLKGARVLDVGTASGFLSFSAEDAGARDVVSFDLDTAARQHLLPFADSLYVTDHARWVTAQTRAFDTWKNAYWLLHRDRRSQARACYGDVYDPPAGLGRFDVVILGAILEHLGDPVRALGAVARLVGGTLVINTDTIEGDAPVALFNGDAARPGNSYVFWTYTVETYRRVLAICGFDSVTVTRGSFKARVAEPGEPRWVLSPRTTIVARRRA